MPTPTIEECIKYFENKGYSKDEAESFFYHFGAQDWVTGSGVPITNWRFKAEMWHKEQMTRNLDKQLKEKQFQNRFEKPSIKPVESLKQDTTLCHCGCGRKAKFRKNNLFVATEKCYEDLMKPLPDVFELAEKMKFEAKNNLR